MRDIKFRAWLNWSNKMYSWDDLLKGVDSEYILKAFNSTDKNEYQFMQFTGLHDKNGKEIYEGDVVKMPEGYGGDSLCHETIGEVLFEEGEFYAWPSSLKDGDWYYKCEIIGNIYENPELLDNDN